MTVSWEGPWRLTGRYSYRRGWFGGLRLVVEESRTIFIRPDLFGDPGAGGWKTITRERKMTFRDLPETLKGKWIHGR